MTRIFTIILLALSLCSFVHVATTSAQIGSEINFCGYYGRNIEVTAPRSDAPALVNATLQRYPMLAFRICTDRLGEHYFLRTPEPVVDGVCMFRERDVYPAVDPGTGNTEALASNAPGFIPTWEKAPFPWETTEPLVDYEREFMAMQQTGCPALETQRYISVWDITAAEFMRLRDTVVAGEVGKHLRIRGLRSAGGL